MRLLTFMIILSASVCLAQESASAVTAAPAITLPPGTRIPLRLGSPLSTKTARAGDPVRAETPFPVTASNALAIPPSTYFEGVIDQVTRRGRHAGFKFHFVNMVFSNGYTVALPAAIADTRAAMFTRRDPSAAALTPPEAMVGGMAFQATPWPPPVPGYSQPNIPKIYTGLIVGVAAAGVGAAVVTAVAFGRRGSFIDLEAGWQFEIVLASPLSLDPERVASAVLTSGAR
jgi:hypothetical protein